MLRMRAMAVPRISSLFCPELQAQGIKVVPYTINDEPTMQRVIDLGVDGIISDDHELLIEVAKRNGLR